MNNKTHLIRIITLSTALSLTLGLVIFDHTDPIKVEAEVHASNYDEYTYSGSYYSDSLFIGTDGMNGTLRTAIGEHVRPAGFYTYGSSGETHLSTQLQYADEDPDNSSNMIMFYTRNSITKTAATVNDTIMWNREHVWCQSLSGPDADHKNWGTTEAGTDILHLRPTYESTNKSRGNDPYGDVGKVGAKYYNDMLYGYMSGGYFEPIDAVKGDVARIIMYIWTTYTDYNDYYPLDILDIFQSYDTLLSWHAQDKPDMMEGNRNDYSESSKQKNRNPFVDHPELAWRIFGDEASANVKNACMAAYPVNQIDPTGISLNTNAVSVTIGNTLQLTSTLSPNGATGVVTWSSSNNNVATVNSNGLITGISAGSVTITARVSQSIYTTCLVTVGEPAGLTKVASYDFSTGNSSNFEYANAANLLTRFNASDVSGVGLSDIVISVSNVSKIYAGFADYYSYGLKFGTSSLTGSFTLGLSQEVSRVVVHTAGWTASDSLTIGDADAQVPGAAYTNNNAIKTLTYDITSSDNVTFLFNKRGFIQSIDFYAEEEEITTPNGYLNSTSSFNEIMAHESATPGEENTIIKTITEIVGTPDSGTRFASLTLNSVVAASVNADGNNGKVYENGTQWRLYQTNNAVITISATGGAAITSVTFTYTVSNTGILKYGNSTLTSGIPVSIASLTSAQFTVANSGSATNGQVRVTAISVTYGTPGSTIVDSVAINYGATIAKSDWDAINALEGYEITDYGAMLVKKNTLVNTYQLSSVEEAYNAGESVYIANKGSGAIPNEEGDNYYFYIQLNVTRASNYPTVYVAVPFIKVNDVYYFLDELECSVNSLAQYYLDNGGSSLSTAALNILAGN